MEKRKLGHSDIYVSKLGLGCMSLGTNSKKANEIIETAINEGVNYFDTADLYDFGVNEEIVGKTLARYREQVVIASKAGNRWSADKTSWTWDPSKKHIKEAVKASLKRLHTDYIDLYQLHGGTIQDPIEETIEAFEELKEEGYIRYYGISSIRLNVIRKYAEMSSIVSNMMQYSLLDRRAEEILQYLYKKQISVVTRGSVAKGLLSNKTIEKLEANEPLAKGFLDYSPEEIKELIESIRGGITQNRAINEIALQYNLANETVASVVTGASSVEQLLDNIRAVNASPLSIEELEYLKMITKENKYTEHR